MILPFQKHSMLMDSERMCVCICMYVHYIYIYVYTCIDIDIFVIRQKAVPVCLSHSCCSVSTASGVGHVLAFRPIVANI